MDSRHIYHSRTAVDTQTYAEGYGRSVLAGRKTSADPLILCLYGDLGSGKTTFIQGLARGLGIPGRLLSPTFILMRRYVLPERGTHFYHIDLYRTRSAAEVSDLGLSEIMAEPGSVVAIEWADRLGTAVPDRRIDIRFSVLQDSSHEIRTDDRMSREDASYG